MMIRDYLMVERTWKIANPFHALNTVSIFFLVIKSLFHPASIDIQAWSMECFLWYIFIISVISLVSTRKLERERGGGV